MADPLMGMQKASACRLGTPCAPRTFKQLLTCCTQHHLLHDFEVIADRSQIRKDRLYAYCSDNDQSQIPFVSLLRVCDVTERWDLIDFALEAHGRRTVEIAPSSATSVMAEAMDVPVAVGDLLKEVQVAICDGRLDDVERSRVRAHLRKTRRELDDVDAALDGQHPVVSLGDRRRVG